MPLMGSVKEKNQAEGSTQRMKTALLRISAFLMEHLWFGSSLDCRAVRCGMKTRDGDEEREERWAS